MRVKSLQISGFKSFVEKTVFTFRPGITGIVGPNGCGKSNVVDAIRWAMGEQSPRHLRGKGMDDVIFAGSELRAPTGVAEVVLNFDNADGRAPAAFAGYSEIQVARRLYRSGESEYLINKVECRLRDVLDFFRDTGIGTRGYTIVEQGRIAEIVSARPEERRILIEEAAGISKYKARRREAERKLEATEQNLVRVTDVIGEIRRQIGSIERQARKAARYKRLRESQRLLELSLAAEERDALFEQIEAARRRSLGQRDAVAEAEARLGESESALEQERVDLVERERALAEGSEALFRLRTAIKELESRIAYERRERASLAEANAARANERERLLERLRAARADAEAQREELGRVDAMLASAAQARAGAEHEAGAAREALAVLEVERETARGALTEALTASARAEDRLAALADRGVEVDRWLRGADEQLELQQTESGAVVLEHRELEEGLRGLLGERDQSMGALRGALDRHAAAAEGARRAAGRLAEARQRRDTRKARLESLRELLEAHEDLGGAARHLLAEGEEGRRRFGLRAALRDVLEPEPELETALAAVLAERAGALVVDRAEGALAALRALREARAGRAVLVVEPAAEPLAPGFVPLGEPLLSRVRPRPGYEAVARALLSGVNLVADLGEAIERYGSSRLPCSFVTREGDVATPEGVVRGGGAREERGHFGRAAEVRGLEQEVAELEVRVRECEQELRELEATLGHAAEQLESLRSRQHTAALAVASWEKDLERTRERAKALAEAEERRLAERARLLAEQDGMAAERRQLGQQLDAAREARVRAQQALDGLGLRVVSASREYSRLESIVAERRVQHASRSETQDRLREGLERAITAASETEDWIAQREAEIRQAETRREELATSISQAELGLADELRCEEEARVCGDERRDAYERAATRVRELDEAVRAARAALAERREQVQAAELALREREFELCRLETQVRDRWSVELASWKAPVPFAPQPEEAEAEAEGGGAEGDAEAEEREARREARLHMELLARPRAEREQRLEELRQSLEALGDVNLGAIEEHEELRERFRFLSEQRADLEKSIAQLREAIARINRTSRKRFLETFEAVDERFRQNFPRLFRGGKAGLSLTEDEDVLEAGIEIMAQPPGKRLQSVNLLSGGEKTMTAIALLVSVFQVRPSPFFLLDEVDAALDDANVGRFNEIMVELARDSQFLLITHNKRTIEVADILYGVTMEERGVSKLVSVELS